jgi:CBS domain-containing protein
MTATPRPITARDIMSEPVVSVPTSCSLRALAALLNENHITGAAVVNDQGALIGVVSETDVIEREAQVRAGRVAVPARPSSGRDWAPPEVTFEPPAATLDGGTVAEVFTPYVVKAAPDTPVATVAALMVRHRVHRLFIVDGDELAGVVSSMDVMRCVSEAAWAPVRHRAVARP